MIITSIRGLRDPFVLVEPNAYYVYGTGTSGKDWDSTVWACYKNTSGNLNGEWVQTDHLVYERPAHAEKNFWAPEVHKYNGAYYMFANYFSSATQHRGCSILKAPTPEGPFVEITNGHITPHNWDAIDGTFYVDSNGQPWMVFVHEWTCTDDGIGRMATAKLSDDLTHFISEPVELFRADSPSWTNERVTDGCFLYQTADGKLQMLWSNFCESGYCVGLAESSGGVDGVWSQKDELLFSKGFTGDYDGGHGMLFTDRDGTRYLAIHSPNTASEVTAERTVFVPVAERDGKLVCLKGEAQ